MSPWELMLWALALLVCVCCFMFALSAIVSGIRQMRRPRRRRTVRDDLMIMTTQPDGADQ